LRLFFILIYPGQVITTILSVVSGRLIILHNQKQLALPSAHAQLILMVSLVTPRIAPLALPLIVPRLFPINVFALRMDMTTNATTTTTPNEWISHSPRSTARSLRQPRIAGAKPLIGINSNLLLNSLSLTTPCLNRLCKCKISRCFSFHTK
jgi:hypothetical protein